MSFDRIPAELKQYPQWIVWKYEAREDDAKPTKVPYNPLTATKADVTNSQTWTTFESAVAAFSGSNGYLSGIGFVLSQNDPYTFIDLDAPKGTPTMQGLSVMRQQKIYEMFDSYSERSPSGTGLHIIVKGQIGGGRRRDDVELYSDMRYMTMTGDVFNDKPIAERQDLLNILWHELEGSSRSGPSHIGDVPEAGPDEMILNTAASASNGAKFRALWQGLWQDLYPSQSEADYALIDIIAFYTQNREQIRRLFLLSALGQRDKATHNKQYIPKMIEKAFDRILPPINVDTLREKFNASMELVKQEQKLAEPLIAAQNTSEALYTAPPGLVGELAQWIYAAAPRPVAEIALIGALGLMAGICGRAYNVLGLGLNQYLLLLAQTGVGKEAINLGIGKLMTAVERIVPAANEFIGPGEIASPQALAKHLSNVSKSFVSIVGEYGLKLQQMTSTRADPNNVGLRRMYLDLYGKSARGNRLRKTIYSNKDANTFDVDAPAFSMLAESAPLRFYEALNEDMISEGFLPRYTVIEYTGDRPALVKENAAREVPERLITQMAQLTSHALVMNQANNVIDVGFAPDADSLLDEFDKFCDAKINNSDRELARNLWTRSHVKALKLAALVAVGENPYSPTITKAAAAWAIRIIIADTENILKQFAQGVIGFAGGESKQMQLCCHIIAEYLTRDYQGLKQYGGTPKLHFDKIVPYTYIQRRLAQCPAFREDRAGGTLAIKRVIQLLVDRGELMPMNKVQLQNNYGTTCIAYAIVAPHVFIKLAEQHKLQKPSDD